MGVRRQQPFKTVTELCGGIVIASDCVRVRGSVAADKGSDPITGAR